jgi:FKBP-type peptidyl-prolyl cis-trans isomerase FkpA
MKLKFSLVAAFVTVLSLSACGGGGGGGSDSTASSVAVANPAQFTKTDTVVGTGTEAVSGKNVTVAYTGYLYSTTAAGNKGAQFDSGNAFSFTLGTKQVIDGFDQGVLGMKVGGKRTVLIPSNLGYGTSGSGSAIPPNAGLVFDITLVSVNN